MEFMSVKHSVVISPSRTLLQRSLRSFMMRMLGAEYLCPLIPLLNLNCEFIHSTPKFDRFPAIFRIILMQNRCTEMTYDNVHLTNARLLNSGWSRPPLMHTGGPSFARGARDPARLNAFKINPRLF